MDFLFLGLTFGTAGKVLLGLAVMLVHWRIVKEHHIDNIVLTEMRRERNVALVGILLIIVAYVLEAMFYGYIPAPGVFSPYLLTLSV